MINLGGYGQSLLTFWKSKGIKGDKLEIRTRHNAVKIGEQEIKAIAALAKIWELEPEQGCINSIKRKLALNERDKSAPQKRKRE